MEIRFSSRMKDLSIEEKKECGRLMNEFKTYAENKINELKDSLEKKLLEEKLNNEKIDVTLPATKIKVGGVHPITKVINEVENELAGEGRVLIRASGTEALIRVMIEGLNQDEIESQAKRIADVIKKKFGA